MKNKNTPYLIWDLDGTLAHLIIKNEEISVWKDEIKSLLVDYVSIENLSPFLPKLELAIKSAIENGAPDNIGKDLYKKLDLWEFQACSNIEIIEENLQLALDFSKKHPSAIVTNNGPSITAKALQVIDEWCYLNKRDSFQSLTVINRSEFVPAKPSPNGLSIALKSLGWKPNEYAVFFGDSLADWEAASAIGIASVAVNGDVWRWANGDKKKINPEDIFI